MVRTSDIRLHFHSRDSRIASLFEKITLDEIIPRKPKDFFVSLCREIIGQQLSATVADVMNARFEKLFRKNPVTPKALLARSDRDLRNTGMSWAKVRFIKDLAANIQSGQLHILELGTLSDDQVIATLTKVKGIGPWTAEMFLIFTLGRPDVFSYGDLGLRRGIQKLYGLKREPSLSYMKRLAKKWQPYRTYAARALWHYKDSL